ncbi:MAG: hypothetical protein COB85_05640 [Bacteroidetes bacterium]|nr:MAG: hypothetical protein COB85_05640 [Bacteroidota bacterium]
MRTIFDTCLILAVILAYSVVGCGLFSKTENGSGSDGQISIIVQVVKNTDIESLILTHRNMRLTSVKLLSARMGTWEMTINYKLKSVQKALRLLNENPTIINAQLNHEVQQRND